MLQIILEKPGQFTARQAEMPTISEGQALVRVQRIGVCGTDLHAFAGRHPIISFDDALLHAREITVLASRNSHNQFPRIIKLIEQKQFDPSPWITHRMDLDRVPEQFEATTNSSDRIKIIIQVPDELA